MAALIAAFVVSMAMLMALQAYYHATTALAHTANRARALMILESQAETMRAAGFAMLPHLGRHAIPSEALRGLPGATGTLLVQPGPTAGMRLVTLEMRWPEEHGPAGQMRVVLAMSSEGMDP
ncbi:MAG: hypothetical protein FJX75_14945 [Armatimonadetes bacterium]|nr:hypothetical protein [Armatimonadota bacterium]